jgi:Arc/MetJ-type ribon-helix-helix transcriptional regulator
MNAAKIAITLDEALLRKVDRLVKSRVYPSRSRAIQEAVRSRLALIGKTRLARECAKLDPKDERAEAELGVDRDLRSWPEY